ncbi:MAG TPA: DUF1501 domain-containing protein [Gemmataceae bacterium]|jgi:uncharacterized protein (DUF1501 family)|nr:DUF1501 domain-containing protein [Gemmataceae bacterium]
MFTRRQLLRRTAAATSFFALNGTLPGLFARSALLAAQADQNDHVLVVVELTGGNDGLNTLIPFENDLYHQNRPVLRIPKENVIPLTDQVGFHPAMPGMAELFKAGKLCVVQGVGYPDPSRSHFRSTEIWHTGNPTKGSSAGWLGRILDFQLNPNDDRMRGLSLADYLPIALQAEKVAVPVINELEQAAAMDLSSPQQKLLRDLSTRPATSAEPIGYLRRQAAAAYFTFEQIRKKDPSFQSSGDYPGEFGKQLRRAAEIISADLGVRLLFVTQGHYDTHRDQHPHQPNLLGELSEALVAFQKDLEDHRVADKVIVLVFSEFGRRVQENACAGTDHGAASCMFLMGARIQGGLAGSYPSLASLDDGDLIHTVDFRSVYATLMEKWLGCPSEKLMGQKFPLLKIV